MIGIMDTKNLTILKETKDVTSLTCDLCNVFCKRSWILVFQACNKCNTKTPQQRVLSLAWPITNGVCRNGWKNGLNKLIILTYKDTYEELELVVKK